MTKKEIRAAINKRFAAKHPEKVHAACATWRTNNAEKVSAYNKTYYQKNKKQELIRNKKWKETNREAYLANLVAYKKNNKALIKAHNAKRTPEQRRQHQALRARRVRMATPKWLDEGQKFLLVEAKRLAQHRTKHFGFEWHVDHIVPLCGKSVSGLNVPWNVQVIPWQDNARKHNKVL